MNPFPKKNVGRGISLSSGLDLRSNPESIAKNTARSLRIPPSPLTILIVMLMWSSYIFLETSPEKVREKNREGAKLIYHLGAG